MWSMSNAAKLTRLPQPEEALPGRPTPMMLTDQHFVSAHALLPPYPPGYDEILFGMGCFWGAEKRFWPLPGVWVTAVGYCAGFTPNPTYEEVCTGRTGHNEVVRVIFDPVRLPFSALLTVFWESHDPTQGMRQGSDVGTQYRSGIYATTPGQKAEAEASAAVYGARLARHGFGPLTTEILTATPFYYAEDYHQQYLAKNPGGYCGAGGTGVICSE